MEDEWVLWPDDHMCPADELDSEVRNGRSDDVLHVIVTQYTDDGMPYAWSNK